MNFINITETKRQAVTNTGHEVVTALVLFIVEILDSE
jgi:hypothetical protein